MRDINLFEGIKKSAPQKKASKAVSVGILILVLSVVALGGIYGWLRYMGYGLDNQIASLNQDISNKQSAAGSDIEGFQSKQNQFTALNAYNNTLEKINGKVQGYPKFNLALLNDIAGRMPADVSARNINYTSGVLSLTCIADNMDSPAAFSAALKGSAYFDSVMYLGSTRMDQTQPELAGKYMFTVNCYMKGGNVE